MTIVYASIGARLFIWFRLVLSTAASALIVVYQKTGIKLCDFILFIKKKARQKQAN